MKLKKLANKRKTILSEANQRTYRPKLWNSENLTPLYLVLTLRSLRTILYEIRTTDFLFLDRNIYRQISTTSFIFLSSAIIAKQKNKISIKLFITRWKTRKRQRRRFLRHVIGRSGSKFSSVVGVIATCQPRQCGHRCLLHPRSAGRPPKGVVYHLERVTSSDQVEQQSGNVEEHRGGPVHTQHHQHRWCGFEVRILLL